MKFLCCFVGFGTLSRTNRYSQEKQSVCFKILMAYFEVFFCVCIQFFLTWHGCIIAVVPFRWMNCWSNGTAYMLRSRYPGQSVFWAMEAQAKSSVNLRAQGKMEAMERIKQPKRNGSTWTLKDLIRRLVENWKCCVGDFVFCLRGLNGQPSLL